MTLSVESELPCGRGFQFVEAIFDTGLVGAEGEHVFAEYIDLTNHLLRKLFQRVKVSFNFEYFGQRSLPDWFRLKRFLFSLNFQRMEASIKSIKAGEDAFLKRALVRHVLCGLFIHSGNYETYRE